MEELLKKSMLELIEYIKQGANFVESQAPLVAQEYLRYNTYKDCIGIAAGLILLSLLILFIPKAIKAEKQNSEYSFVLMILAMAISLGGCAFFFVAGLDLLKILTAPRLYVLEGIRALI